MAQPDQAAVDVLEAGGIGLAENVNLFLGPVRPPVANYVPAEAVFCLVTGGPEPTRFVDGTGANKIRRSIVQVTIRSQPNAFESGQSLARNVLQSLEDDDWSGYIEANVRESAPVYLGKDDIEHHRWVLNVETWIEEG